MKSFKSKKSKIILTCLAVAMIVSILCVVLAGCKPSLASPTPLDVYFVGDFQSDVSAEQLKAITKEGETIWSITDALDAANIDYKSDPVAAAAAMYAVAVTNYGNITQSGYYVLTDASVNAKKVNLVFNNDVNVGVRSTYSSFTGKNGTFSQTVSGVTKLEGFGGFGDQVKTNFGYNIQSFSNDKFSASRRGNNGGAQFPSFADDANVLKYILGGYNTSLTDKTKAKDVTLKLNSSATESKPLPEYIQAAGAKYPSNSTLKNKELPSFNKDRKAWEPLNRLPARYWEGDKIIENHTVVASTRYSFGTYGAGFAVYDFSRPEYLDSTTKISYNSDLKLWEIEVAVKSDYVDQACEFAVGDLVKDTKDYIQLKNAKFTKVSCKIEIYESGLIKSMQKADELISNEKCKMILGASCDSGATSNKATMAFSYSDNDTNAERFAALYWPELGKDYLFTDKGYSKDNKLDLSKYDTFANYKPQANQTLLKAFRDLFSNKTASGNA